MRLSHGSISKELSKLSYCRFAGATLLPWKTTARTFSSA
jgi:hypothetical protein